MFLLALADTRPDELDRLPTDGRFNPMAISLDPSPWSDDGLCGPDAGYYPLADYLPPLLKMIDAPDLVAWVTGSRSPSDHPRTTD